MAQIYAGRPIRITGVHVAFKIKCPIVLRNKMKLFKKLNTRGMHVKRSGISKIISKYIDNRSKWE